MTRATDCTNEEFEGNAAGDLTQPRVLTIGEVKVVTKPWGWEKWIADGRPNFPYVLKEILIHAPCRSSLQLHRIKQESNYVLKGQGVLYYSEQPLDVERYEQGGYSQEEIQHLICGLQRKELAPGTVFHVLPGFLHRVEAIEELLMIETSTTELDDVLRLQDDTGRMHGRIAQEHGRAV